MIKQTFESLTPRKTYQLPWTGSGNTTNYGLQRPYFQDRTNAIRVGITPEEYVRRDKVVMALWATNPYKSGDQAYPVDKKMADKYGLMTVKEAYTNYTMFTLKEQKEWTKDDQPYIFTCSSEKIGGLVLVTAGWLVKKYKGA